MTNSSDLYTGLVESGNCIGFPPKALQELLFIYLFIGFVFVLLEYSCFSLLCHFLLYSKVNQLYVYIYPLFFGFPSHLDHHRALSRVPCAIQYVLITQELLNYL